VNGTELNTGGAGSSLQIRDLKPGDNTITVNVTATFDPATDESLRDTFKRADEAMYIEKKRQKGIAGGEIR